MVYAYDVPWDAGMLCYTADSRRSRRQFAAAPSVGMVPRFHVLGSGALPELATLVDRLIAWVEPLYAAYGYPVVFAGGLLEHTFFLAWLMPGGVVIALGGLYAGLGVMHPAPAILLGAAGFCLGDHLDFYVGRRGSKLIDRYTRGTAGQMSRWGRRGLPAIVLAYTNAIPRAALFMGGAAAGMSYSRFLALSASLALAWSTAFTLAGYFLGSNRQYLDTVLKAVGIGGQAVLLLLAAVVAVSVWRLRRGSSRRADTA